MASRATSEPVAHGQEGKGKVLYVGGDDRETLLKGLRNRAFNRRKLSPQREVVRESRKVVYAVNTTKATIPCQASRRALSVPLTRRTHSRLTNFDANTTGARAPSDVGRTGLSNPSGILSQPNTSLSQPRRAPLSQYLADETGLPPVSDDGQHPSFHERPFLKGTGTGKTRWFRSSSAHQLLCPNEDVAGAVGDLYVYTNIRSRITYIWVMHPVEGWVSITAGGNHPTVPNRRLRIRKDGDPSWVQIRSLISMESRERRR